MATPDYVEWFVNREKQRQGFLMMLKGETRKQIMVIKAPTEMGKTWLIQHLFHDCRSRNVPVTVLDFSRRQPWDLLTIVRQARDELGSASFNHMTEVINDVTTTQVNLSAEKVDVNVKIEHSQITDSQINVGEVKLTTDHFKLVQADNEVVRRNLELRITDAFLVCLEALAQGQKVVFLLDTLEMAPSAASQWLLDNLLWRIRNGKLPNVLVIMAGRESLDLDDTWKDWVARTGLDLFTGDHIKDFIAKRGLQNRPDVSVDALMLFSRGHPGMLGKMADNALIDDLAKEKETWM